MTVTTMLDVRTTRFGDLETVEVSEEAIVTFPEGLPGFERHTRFALMEHERLEPFLWLQSLADPLIGFLVIEPAVLVDDYSFDLGDPDVELLALSDDVQPRVFSVLVVPEDVRAMTANLQAPIVVNPASRLGKQVILTDDRFSLRHPVFGGAPARTGHRRAGDAQDGEARHGDVRHGGVKYGGAKHAARRRAC